MERVRILYITEIFPDPGTGLGYWGGGERGFYELARRAAAEGNEVMVLTCRFPGQTEEDTIEGVRVRRLGLSRDPRTGGVLKSPLKVLDYMRKTYAAAMETDCDIIHCNAYYPIVPGALAGRVRGLHTVSTIHDMPNPASWREYVGSSFWGTVGYLLTVLAARSAGGTVVTVSDQAKAKLAALGIGKVEVVRNGVDIELLDSLRGAKERAKILYVGRLVRYKRVDVLLRALTLVASRVEGVRAVIVGDGPEMPSLKALAASLGVSHLVEFAGTLPGNRAVARLYADSTVFVLPSVVEGEGIVLKEAMAAKLPVIATDVPGSGVLGVVKDGWNGVLVRPGDEKGLSDAIVALLTDAGERERMGENGRRSVESWTWDDVTKTVLGLYRRLLAESRH